MSKKYTVELDKEQLFVIQDLCVATIKMLNSRGNPGDREYRVEVEATLRSIEGLANLISDSEFDSE